MSVVYGREIDGKAVQFGTTGYTKNHVFVLYDRTTESVWYPMTRSSMDAVSGPWRGRKIPFIAKPKPMPLREWKRLHPETTVMLPVAWVMDGIDRWTGFGALGLV